MGELYSLPEKREPKAIEDIYRREFGFVICPHKIYLPGSTPERYCEPCHAKAAKELQRILFG